MTTQKYPVMAGCTKTVSLMLERRLMIVLLNKGSSQQVSCENEKICQKQSGQSTVIRVLYTGSGAFIFFCSAFCIFVLCVGLSVPCSVLLCAFIFVFTILGLHLHGGR